MPHTAGQIKLSLITPEAEPLAIFGIRASAAVRGLLEQAGVALHTSSLVVGRHPGWLDLAPGDRGIPADRIVIEPRLVGPRIRGIPRGRDGFLPTDRHGRVPGLDGVFAAGDATAFPIKQGGLAAQQAGAVAEAIASMVGVDIDPQPFRPVLRGVLLTGAASRYLRADISGAGDDSTISTEPLWWPPNKLCGRYLAPYLSRPTGDGADVMPQQHDGLPVEIPLDGVSELAEVRPTPAWRPSIAEHPLERSASPRARSSGSCSPPTPLTDDAADEGARDRREEGLLVRSATSASFRTRPSSSHSTHSRWAASSSSSARRPMCAAMFAASATNAPASACAVAPCARLWSSCHVSSSPARSRSVVNSSSWVSQTVSASGIAACSAFVSGGPSSRVKAKRPPGRSVAAISRTNASLSSKASIVSSRSTTSKEPARRGGTCAIAKRHGRSGARCRAMATALALASTPR